MSNFENVSTDVNQAVADDQSADVVPTRTEIVWLNTETAAQRLGITTRTLYRFINEGGLPAYRMGRVIRVKQSDVDVFIDASRIQPGSLSHLYPEPLSSSKAEQESDDVSEDDVSEDHVSQGYVSGESEAGPAY